MAARSPARSVVRSVAFAVAALAGGQAIAPAALATEPAAVVCAYRVYNPNDICQRRNLLTRTADFGHADWNLNNAVTITQDATLAPDNTLTADKLVETTASSVHNVARSLTAAGARQGERVTLSVYLKAGERGYAFLGGNNTTDFAYAGINLSTGEVLAAAPGLSLTATSEIAQNGFWRFIVSFIPSGGAFTWDVRISTDGNWANRSYLGVLTNGIYAWGAQAERGGVATPYQPVTDWTTEYLAAALRGIGMWQDNGTTPVTAVEQVVGMLLDTENDLARGPELVTNNGPFATAAASVADQAADLSNSTTYELRYTASAAGAGNIILYANGFAATHTVLAGTNRIFVQTTTATAAATDTIRISGLAAGTVTLHSVKAIPGNHLTMPSKPVLSARWNQLLATEDIENANWQKANTGTALTAPVCTRNFAAAPDGTITAQRIQLNKGAGTTTTDLSEVFQNLAPSLANTRRVWARSNSGGSVTVILGGGAPQVVGTAWQEFAITNQIAERPRFMLRGGQTPACSDTADLLIWHPDLRQDGAAALNQPAYQRVNTATDYDSDGFVHFLRFDGAANKALTSAFAGAGSHHTMLTSFMHLGGGTLFGVLMEWGLGAPAHLVSVTRSNGTAKVSTRIDSDALFNQALTSTADAFDGRAHVVRMTLGGGFRTIAVDGVEQAAAAISGSVDFADSAALGIGSGPVNTAQFANIAFFGGIYVRSAAVPGALARMERQLAARSGFALS